MESEWLDNNDGSDDRMAVKQEPPSDDDSDPIKISDNGHAEFRFEIVPKIEPDSDVDFHEAGTVIGSGPRNFHLWDATTQEIKIEPQEVECSISAQTDDLVCDIGPDVLVSPLRSRVPSVRPTNDDVSGASRTGSQVLHLRRCRSCLRVFQGHKALRDHQLATHPDMHQVVKHPAEHHVHPDEPDEHDVNLADQDVHHVENDVHHFENEVHHVENEVHHVENEVHHVENEVHPAECDAYPVEQNVHPAECDVHPVEHYAHPVEHDGHPVQLAENDVHQLPNYHSVQNVQLLANYFAQHDAHQLANDPAEHTVHPTIQIIHELANHHAEQQDVHQPRHQPANHPAQRGVQKIAPLIAPRYYTCNQCSKVFAYEEYLRAHRQRVHGVVPSRKPTPKAATNNGEPSVESSGVRSGRHQCQICGERFTTSLSLIVHRAAHRKEADYHRCDQCSKLFPTKGHLHDHLQRVHGVRQPSDSRSWVQCDDCTQSFSSRNGLRVHRIQRHAGKQLDGATGGKCNRCGKTVPTCVHFNIWPEANNFS